jgi:drug/metabolite transporter (DMT)-like permease
MFIWGGSFIAIKIGLRYLTPYELVVARFVPSALLLFPLGVWSHRRKNGSGGFWRALTGRERLALVGLAFLAVPAYHVCLNTGETLIPAGWASLVISLNPACIVTFAALMLSERVGWRRFAGITLAFIGLVYIVLMVKGGGEAGIVDSVGRRLLGVAITLGAVLSWGWFTVGSKRLIAKHDPLSALGWTMLLGVLWLIPGLPVELPGKLAAAPAELWWAVGFLSVGCTVIGFAVWFKVLERWKASRAGVFIYLVPLFALFQGNLVLHEPLGIHVFIGAAAVLGGVILAGTGGG